MQNFNGTPDNLKQIFKAFGRKPSVVYPGSAKCGFWKGKDSEPPCQSARYLTLSKSAILLTPDIPPRVAQSLHHKTRVPLRSCAIYIGVQNYKSSKSSAPSANPRTGRSAIYLWRHYQLEECHQEYNHEC